jgi:drug/metabolite transporter (DMT)-like permease
VYASIAVGYMPFVWSRAHRDSTAREFRMNWRRILIASFATVGSYLAALIGLSMTAASYVASVRATSVVMGALLGWLFLKEQLGALRVFAAALMVVGLVLIAVA